MIVVGALVVSAVYLLPPAQPTQSSTFQSSQATSHLGSIATFVSTTVTTSSSSCPLWKYATQFNWTITIANDTILLSAENNSSILVPPHASIYLGFTLVGVAQISGEVKSDTPINVEVIKSSANQSIFPVGTNDRILAQETNTTEAKISLPTGISGTIGAGNYALVFVNTGGIQANLNASQSITIVYENCL